MVKDSDKPTKEPCPMCRRGILIRRAQLHESSPKGIISCSKCHCGLLCPKCEAATGIQFNYSPEQSTFTCGKCQCHWFIDPDRVMCIKINKNPPMSFDQQCDFCQGLVLPVHGKQNSYECYSCHRIFRKKGKRLRVCRGPKNQPKITEKEWQEFLKFKNETKTKWEKFQRFLQLEDDLWECSNQSIEYLSQLKDVAVSDSEEMDEAFDGLEKNVWEFYEVLSQITENRSPLEEEDCKGYKCSGKSSDYDDTYADKEEYWDDYQEYFWQSNNSHKTPYYNEVTIEDVTDDLLVI